MGVIDWEQWEQDAEAARAAKRAERMARPRWRRIGGWVFAWTIGLGVSVLICAFVVAIATGWNPAGGQ